MMAMNELKRRNMENNGFRVVKIDVDVVELIDWAASRDICLDPESRTKFAMKKLKELSSEKSLFS